MTRKSVLYIFLLLALTTSTVWTGVSQESAQAPLIEEVIIPEGTILPIVLTDYLNTRSSQAGDTFYADTTYPIWVQQRLVIPKGSNIRGTVTEVVRPGRIKGKGRLAVRFDDVLLPNGVKRDLSASFRGIHGPGDESFDRKSETVTTEGSQGEDAGTVVATTSQGTILGAVIGGGKGAAIGAGTGAAAGLATILFTRGKDLVIAPGTRFDLELKRPMKFANGELEFSNSQIDEAQRNSRQRPLPQNPASERRRIGIVPGIGFPRIF